MNNKELFNKLIKIEEKKLNRELSKNEEKELLERCKKIKALDYTKMESKDTKFIFYPYIPLGKIVVFAGDPGVGKSSLALKFASIVSNGSAMPFENERIEKDVVIIQNNEDDVEDTIKPRLEAMGANFDNIITIDEEKHKMSLKSQQRLIDTLEVYKPRLVIIDPLQDYIGDINMDKANSVRQLLSPISRIARKYNCTFIFIMHLNKGDNKGLYRALGSIDFMGIARSSLMIGKNPSNQNEVLVEHTKHNLSEKGKSFAYKIIMENKKFKDIEFLDYRDYQSFDDYRTNNDSKELKGRELAKTFLNVELESNDMGAIEIKSKAEKYGIPPATLERAKADLGIKSKKVDNKSYWYIP